MNIIDIILLICLIPFLIEGVKEGIIRQSFGIFALFIGVWAAYSFGSLVALWISDWFNVSSKLVTIIAFILVFILIFIGIVLIGKALENIVKLVSLGWVDKVFGLVFAILKYILIIGVLIIVFEALNTNFGLVKQKILNDSALYGPIKRITIKVFPYLQKLITKTPEIIKDHVEVVKSSVILLTMISKTHKKDN